MGSVQQVFQTHTDNLKTRANNKQHKPYETEIQILEPYSKSTQTPTQASNNRRKASSSFQINIE